MPGHLEKNTLEHLVSAHRIATQEWEMIEQALRGLQFGQVTVVVQDGRVIQVDRLERRRLSQRPALDQDGPRI